MQNAEPATRGSGDYEIVYSIERPRGMYEFSDGKLEWKEPQDENVALDVFPTDPLDGRFIPGLHIVASLIDRRGQCSASSHLPFVWHPERHRYSANLNVPESGEYVLHVHVYPATFARADKAKGQRFIADVNVQFERVRIEL